MTQRPKNAHDWYPYHATPTVIAALLRAGITPAHCRIGDMVPANGRRLLRGGMVAIWDTDLPAFCEAVKPAHRVEVLTLIDANEKLPDLDALAAKQAERSAP